MTSFVPYHSGSQSGGWASRGGAEVGGAVELVISDLQKPWTGERVRTTALLEHEEQQNRGEQQHE